MSAITDTGCMSKLSFFVFVVLVTFWVWSPGSEGLTCLQISILSLAQLVINVLNDFEGRLTVPRARLLDVGKRVD